MAFYVKLNKIFENETVAQYSFGGGDALVGKLEIDKANGEVILLQPLKGDDANFFFYRARAKISKEWKEGRFPNLTEWAS